MNRKLPSLNALLALETVLRTGSVKHAAKELAVTPAAVSQHLRHIEDLLGVPLLVRRARGITLTEEAERLRPRLGRGFDALEEALAPLAHPSRRARVVLSIMPSLGRTWLLPLLPEIRARLPHIDLVVNTETRLVDFDREEASLAVRYCEKPEPGLASARLFGEVVFPVCSPGLAHGLTALPKFEEVGRFPLLHDVDASRHGAEFAWETWLPKMTSGFDASISFNDGSLLLDAVEAGLGFALGRSPLVWERLRAGRLVRPWDVSRASARAYFVVTSRRLLRKTAVRDVVEYLEAQGPRFRGAFEDRS